MTLLCVCLQMANLVTSLCCVVLAAVVVAYAQRRSQLGEYAFYPLLHRNVPLLCRGLRWPALLVSSCLVTPGVLLSVLNK